MRSYLKNAAHICEYLAAKWLIGALSHLRPEVASRTGAFIARHIGRWLPVSKIADRNLRFILPQSTIRERQTLIRQAWGHLGATIGEFPHLSRLRQNPEQGAGWLIEGEENLLGLQNSDRPIIFFSGHIGNWEMLPPIVAGYGLAFSPFYREAGNPYINRLIASLREKAVGQPTPMFPKGAKGARAAMLHLKNKGRLGVLGDQKMNDGIKARLFDADAMSASATASFALKYGCPIVPGVMTRLGPARLLLRVEAPIVPVATDDRQKDVHDLTQRLNDRLQDWIARDPTQWLLFHRRWPKPFYKGGN